MLWARKIFKTKPNREIPENLKNNINTIFHHLTKDELVEKLLANYMNSQAKVQERKEEGQQKNKK